ncbi:MAG: hypothetical protein DHS20C17_12870 [Cyclobacteriaceae bacterium]|nr:MAG: hypothetical protein DHS20C17_12870 [Cyclobacteriaceae bacterium]
MKTFLILLIAGFCLTVSAQAQQENYVPNARQAVQKSRMQQPQYFEVTNDMVSDKNDALQVAPAKRPTNYQMERPVAIDAPKRRGKRIEQSSFVKLASYNKK